MSDFEPLIVRSGRWLTKRRGILLTPFFTVALISSRSLRHWGLEFLFDGMAVLCLLTGTWLRLVAASYHESAHHSEPITAGPYAWVRHPLYLSNFLLGLGIVLFTGWWPMMAAYALFFLPLHGVIAYAEEVHLISLYGDRYENYRRAVCAILPFKRFQGPSYGSRSEFKLRKGKEMEKAAGYFLGAAAVCVFKLLRGRWRALPLPPLSLRVAVLMGLAAAAAVIYRPPIRWAWLRSVQTVLATVCVILLAIHVPGLWPTPAPRTISSNSP